MEKDFGFASAGLRSNLPEIIKREAEVNYFILTKDQENYYLKVGKAIELRKWKAINPDFMANNTDEKINIVK